jgi:hypothetical protein
MLFYYRHHKNKMKERWEGTGREGKGREGKGREGKGREGKITEVVTTY